MVDIRNLSLVYTLAGGKNHPIHIPMEFALFIIGSYTFKMFGSSFLFILVYVSSLEKMLLIMQNPVL